MAEWQQFGPVWFIPGENHGKYPFCHSVYVEGAGVLIDPAFADTVHRLTEKTAYIELAESTAYQEYFIEEMGL